MAFLYEKKKKTLKTERIETDICAECILVSLGAWLETSYIWITHIVTLTSPEWITHGSSPPMCAGIWSVQCSGPDGGHVHRVRFTCARASSLAHARLLAFPMPICSEDVCQCSIKIPSDKRFKSLPLWVMRTPYKWRGVNCTAHEDRWVGLSLAPRGWSRHCATLSLRNPLPPASSLPNL